MVATVAVPENKGFKNDGEEGVSRTGWLGESHSPLTRRSVQTSVLLRAVNIRRHIKLTWRVGRGHRERGKASDHTGARSWTVPAGFQPCPCCPIVAPTRGEQLARSCLGPRVRAIRGWVPGDAFTSSRGGWRAAPELELPSSVGTKPT